MEKGSELGSCKPDIDEDTAGKVLDTIYSKALVGIPKMSQSVEELASNYLKKSKSPRDAAQALCRIQVAKCGTSGFLTGLGGLITLPVAVPANIGSVLYVQMRMVAAVAKIGGYDITSDQVQTMVYMCLVGTAVNDIAKEAGIKIGTKTLEVAVKKIPGTVLTKVNQKIGFRLITKFGEKGVINLGKAIPLAGGVVGGAFDIVSTSVIAKTAIKAFIDTKGDDEGFQEHESEAEADEPEGVLDVSAAAADADIQLAK